MPLPSEKSSAMDFPQPADAQELVDTESPSELLSCSYLLLVPEAGAGLPLQVTLIYFEQPRETLSLEVEAD